MLSSPRLFDDTVEDCAQQFSAVQKQTEAIQHILPRHDAPLRRRASPSLLVALGALLCPPELLTDERAQSVLNCLGSFRGKTVVPLKQFQRPLGHMASTAAVTPLRLLHMRPLQHCLHSRVPRWAWHHGTLRVNITQECRCSFSPWTDLDFLRAGVSLEQVSRHVVVTTDASSTGWGATCNGPWGSGRGLDCFGTSTA